jgi:hypothetical protein
MRVSPLVFDRVEQVGWLDSARVPLWDSWGSAESAEEPIHRIHAYPARFPAHIATNSFDVAKRRGLKVRAVADVFCGCGTVAYESLIHGYSFWGCDVNPVAALIARVKSSSFSPDVIAEYARAVLSAMRHVSDESELAAVAQSRLRHWYSSAQFADLARLKNAIDTVLPDDGPDRDLLLCSFSAILKRVSQWKARSAKPAYDLGKEPDEVAGAFDRQMRVCADAWRSQAQRRRRANGVSIEVASATNAAPSSGKKVDLLITSPPYVTSYEYADIHQLSLLWLGHTNDHRSLRAAMVGGRIKEDRLARYLRALNRTGAHIALSLYGVDPPAAAAVARYFSDMQRVAQNCFDILRVGGLAFFVIGNSRHRGVHLDNASHLVESLIAAGFKSVEVGKRPILNKRNTPYRSADGRLSKAPHAEPIYSHEYVLVAEK